MLPPRDRQLVQIVDAAAAQAASRAGEGLRCGPGCSQCCVGVFPITQLDASRLREGLADLRLSDPGRADAVEQRVRETVARLTPAFPGNVTTGILDPGQAEAFEEFANEEPCPALDPATGLCDVYTARPLTCRLFGLPLRTPEGLGVCELCFQGASPEEIAAAEVHDGWQPLESVLTKQVEAQTGLAGATIVAWALRG